MALTTLIWQCALSNASAQNQGGNYYTPTYSYGAYPASGFGGRNTSNSFNGGFSGLGASQQPQYVQPQRPPQQYQQQQYRQPPRPSYAAPQAGTSTMAGLENVLNQVDNSNWSNVPVSGRPQQQQRPAQLAASPAGSMPNNMRGGMFPRMSRQEMMRIFMEGGTPMGMGGGGGGAAPPQSNSAATSTAYSNYQTACNEESKSRNYANTARYDGSKWNRKNAAEQAEYAANNANYAAQRAESAAYNGDSQARGYANLAREAANRARENANQARYNADTMP